MGPYFYLELVLYTVQYRFVDAVDLYQTGTD